MAPAVPLVHMRDRISGWLKDELRPTQCVASVSAALALYLLEVVVVLSITALIFSGRLADQLPYAISFALVGCALLVTIVSLFSSYGGSIAVTQDTTGVILALAVASIVAVSPPGVAPEALFPSLIVLLAGSSLAMGVIYLSIGVFRLGSLVRFLPYPVLGGFLAGTGWLLTIGGLGVAANVSPDMDLLRPDVFWHWLPAAVLGVVTVLALRRWKSALALAGVLAAALLGFHAVVWLLGVPHSTLAAAGWLPGPFPQDAAWRFPLDTRTLPSIDWPALVSALPIAAPALLIGVIGLLLNASGLELIVRRDIVLNRELVVAGAANLASGLVGGLIGYPTISFSAFNHALRNGRRLPGLIVAGLLILTTSGGAALLMLVPRFILGGLLIYIGLGLLYEWVIQSWSGFARIDYAIILSILAIIAFQGFLWGIGLGLLMTILMFVVSSSRTNVIHYELTGQTHHSRMNRGPQQWQALQTHGDQLTIFKLRGFIFFGTAHNLCERVRERANRAAGIPARYALLDFEQVSGLDSTALLSFNRLLQYTRDNQIELIMTGLASRARNQLLRGGFTGQTPGLHLFSDMDRGIEWCEDQIIATVQASASPEASLHDHLVTILPDSPGVAALIQQLRRREVAAGEYIIREGEEPDALFFLESGQLTAQLEKPGREPVRLETMQGGHVVGELGFFLGTRRNASVIADRPSVVYSLSRAEWDQLTRQHPEIAQTLHSLLIRFLGQRVAHLTRAVEALNY